MGSRAGLVEKVEMIGEREIDFLLLPEMSRAERARRAKNNEQFPLSCPQPEAAPPRRGGARMIGRSSIMATLEGKSHCITPFGLYPASRVSGRGPAGLGKTKLLLPWTGVWTLLDRCAARRAMASDRPG